MNFSKLHSPLLSERHNSTAQRKAATRAKNCQSNPSAIQTGIPNIPKQQYLPQKGATKALSLSHPHTIPQLAQTKDTSQLSHWQRHGVGTANTEGVCLLWSCSY